MAGAGAASAGGRYQILGHLAQGGMGEILLARRLGPAGFQKLVVLKRPLAMPAGAGSRALAAALIEEARLLARINHPNVCQVHDLEEADGQFYLSLEFLEGLTLWTILARLEAQGGALAAEPGVLCGLFEQVCDGLDAIHGMRGRAGAPAGVVHRDISPGNLFVTESGTVKILDLGIAKSSESEDRTPFGRVKGKLPYVSPEQAAGRPIDGRSDLFALGFVIYDLARGRRPPPDRIGALAHDALELGGLPAELAAIVARATAADPARRFASARELGGALRAAAARLGGSGGSSGRAELAAWLARRFGPELARRRARTEEAIAGGAEPATATRQLSLRSVISLDEPDAIGSGGAAARATTAGTGAGTAMAPGMRSRETERLMLPEDERLPRREPASEAAVVAPSRRSGSRTRTIVLVGLGALGVAALGVLAAVLLGRNAPTAPRSGASASASAASVASAQAAPSPEPAASARPTESREAAVEPTAVPVPAATLAPEPAQPVSAGTTEPAAAPATPPQRRSDAAPARSRPASRTASAASGTVTIDSSPYAVVHDGGVSLGATPIYRRPMKPGRHRLRATAADGREQVFVVDVEAGRETLRRLDWSGR
jgi:hypothetical protein